METIKSLRNSKNRRAIIQKTCLGEYQTTCFVNGCDIAPAHPPKTYKTIGGADRYARKFLSK